jgi:hypothetical protein
MSQEVLELGEKGEKNRTSIGKIQWERDEITEEITAR